MKQNLEFRAGEITVYCGENARINTQESFKQALNIIRSGKGNVLFINTVFTTRQLYEVARKISGSVEHEGLHYHQVIMGDLYKYFKALQEVIEKENIKTLIINSWEFSNNGYSYREKALFQLKHYAEVIGVAVLVYSQAPYAHKAGKIARGGLGKLAVIASEIVHINTNEIERLQRERQEFEREKQKSAMSSTGKINELSYARSDSGISAGGELVLPGTEELEEVFDEGELIEV